MTRNQYDRDYFSKAWADHYIFGRSIVACKRNRRNVYTVSADCRHALVILLDNRLPQAGGKREPMTLNNARKTWWMSENQFQQMLTRLGLPF